MYQVPSYVGQVPFRRLISITLHCNVIIVVKQRDVSTNNLSTAKISALFFNYLKSWPKPMMHAVSCIGD